MRIFKDFENIIVTAKPDTPALASKMDISAYLSDFFNSASYSFFLPKEIKKSKLQEYYSCKDIWVDALNNKLSPGKKIILKNFYISEWLPVSPGRYFTNKADQSRKEAEDLMNEWKTEFLPNGKLRMIEGGIGCIRLASVNSACYFGASENGICHQGFPLQLSNELRDKYFDEIKTNGYVFGDISGTVEILPPTINRFQYVSEIPRYILSVQKIQQRKAEEKEICITIAMLYSEGSPNFDTPKKYTFASFFFDCKENNLSTAVNWIENYAQRHSQNKGDIFFLTDFDEHKQHFKSSVNFELSTVMKHGYSNENLKNYFGTFKIKVMGDNNIINTGNAKYINLSGGDQTIKNSFNGMQREQINEIIKRLSEIIEQNGQADAIEVFSGLKDELEKEKPRVSILRSLWSSLLILVPVIKNSADLYDRIINFIGSTPE